MSSIGSLTGSSSSSSIYGSRTNNIISGLASGLDTESMIEGLVQSYQQKIQGLQQDRTVLQWQQNAYQSISDKLVEFSRKYMSYTSNTNLLSSAFFTNAVTTTTSGKYADLVSAIGKSNSTIELNSVSQLATTARYTVSGQNLDKLIVNENDKITAKGSNDFNLNGKYTTSNMDGSITITYGTQKITLDFDKDDRFVDEQGNFDKDELQRIIQEKLADQTIKTNDSSKPASELIQVDVDANGRIAFSDQSDAGNNVYLSAASGNFKDFIKEYDSTIKDKNGVVLLDISKDLTTTMDNLEYLSEKTLEVTLNGKTKTITMPSYTSPPSDEKNQQWLKALQEEFFTVFGDDKIKVTHANNQISFEISEGSTLSVISSDSAVNEIMGLGETGVTSYLNTQKTLGELLGDDTEGELGNLKGTPAEAIGDVTAKLDDDGNSIIGKDGEPVYVDEEGNTVKQDSSTKEWYQVDDDGKTIYEYNLTINGESIGSFTKDTELATVLNAINNSEAGVNVSYSNITGEFVFTAKDSGSAGRIDFGDGLASTLFASAGADSKFEAGQDAKFTATINGKEMKLTRSSNSFEIDGMTITVNGTFNVGDADGAKNDPVTFTSKADSDTIVDTIKQMVEDYNTILSEVKKAYSDIPLQKSDGSKYEPLTDADMEDMSDTAIENYEEKAKTGILFMDTNLSSLYNELRNAISGSNGAALRAIGIDAEYSDGLTTLTLDETALRQALEQDPDKVQSIFTQSKEYGASTDGLMTTLLNVTDKYAATTGATKGILIEKAGSKYSPTSALQNDLLDKMNDIDDEISTWQTKMSDKVDYYTNKFTQLEMLINEMNSQSSALASFLGG